MPRLVMRFDLRNLDQRTNVQLYRDTLDLVQWADQHGFDSVQLAEHHGCDDGYIPSPLVFGGAMAARTQRVRLRFVLILPHYNPLRLAEDLAVLDIASGGRVVAIVVAGYAPHEFEMFGVELSDRGRLMEEGVEVLRKAWTGKPFEYRGRTVRVMPQPVRGAELPLWMGGSSLAAARRAARYTDRFYSNDTALWDVFRAARLAHGNDPGPAPTTGAGMFVVSEDPDREWERMGPYIAAELEVYAKLGASRRQLLGDRATESDAQQSRELDSLKVDLQAIRAMNAYPILTPAEAKAHVESLGAHDELTLNPLISGLPIELAREQLATFARHVLPLVR